MASNKFSRVSLILPIYLPALLLSTGAGIISPTESIYINSFKLSYTLTTFVISVRVLGNIPAGILVERIGRKSAMLLGLVMVVISTIAMGIAQNLFQLLGAQLIGGIGNALWMLSRHAYMTDVIPFVKRGRSIALFGGVNRMGTFAGKFGAIFLGANLRLPFFVYAVFAVLTFSNMLYTQYPTAKHGKQLIISRNITTTVSQTTVSRYFKATLQPVSYSRYRTSMCPNYSTWMSHYHSALC